MERTGTHGPPGSVQIGRASGLVWAGQSGCRPLAQVCKLLPEGWVWGGWQARGLAWLLQASLGLTGGRCGNRRRMPVAGNLRGRPSQAALETVMGNKLKGAAVLCWPRGVARRAATNLRTGA